MRQQLGQAQQLAADNSRLSDLMAQTNASQSVPPGQLRELLRLRGEIGALRQQNKELGRLQQENSQLRAAQPAIAQNQVAVQSQILSAQEGAPACIDNLRQIDGAMQQYALESTLSASDTVTAEQILPYLKRAAEALRCPSGGTYTFGELTNTPICSIPGHAIPKN